jgi:hypothetical protein
MKGTKMMADDDSGAELGDHEAPPYPGPLRFEILLGLDTDNYEIPEKYEFKTQAEAAAFWRGVNDAEGWNGYVLLKDGDTFVRDGIQENGDVMVVAKNGERELRESSKF